MGRTYSRNDPPIADNEPDHGAAGVQKVIRTPAGAPIQKPVGAAASVFEIAKPAPKPARRPYSPRDLSVPNLAALVIIKDRPIPPPEHAAKAAGNTYAQPYDRMGPGGSVDLTKRQRMNFQSWAKRQGKKLIVRRLAEDQYAVWRPTTEQEQQHADV